MVVLLQICEIIFKKGGNLENIIHISQNMAKILTENFLFNSFLVFLKLPWRKYY